MTNAFFWSYLKLVLLRQFNFLCCLCITDLDDQTYEYKNTINADAHSNAITELYALSNNSESHTDSKICHTFYCYVLLYFTRHKNV